MDIDEKFNDFYNKAIIEYKQKINEMELHRKKAEYERKRNKILMIIIDIILIILSFTCMYYTTDENRETLEALGISFLSLPLFSSVFISLFNKKSLNKYEQELKEYKKEYKENIIKKLIQTFYPSLDYVSSNSNEYELSILASEYTNANFDKTFFNTINSDDYIEGFLDDITFIKMSDMHIQNHTVTKDGKYIEDIFQGLFVNTRNGRDIGTYIKISINNDFTSSESKIEMDSQEFEKYFDVYSENKILAMQLLTSDTMLTLIDFYNKYKIQFEIVIKNNNIYIRFFTGPMFEAKIFKDLLDKDLLLKYINILIFAVDITKEITKSLPEV